MAKSLVNAMPGAPNMSDRQKAPIVRLSEMARQRGVKLIAVQLPLIRAGWTIWITEPPIAIFRRLA